MSDREYYSDEEDISDREYERRVEWNKIKDIPLQSYLKCGKTRDLLKTDYLLKFHEQLEPKLDAIFRKYFEECKGTGTNIMYRAEENHFGDFSNLVFVNLYKNYDMSIFEENPHLAKPMVSMLEEE